MNMDFKTLNKRALEIRAKYDQLNLAKRNVQWSAPDFMAGLVGDIGDLSKIIMAKEGLRAMDDIDKKLAHELSDCFWSLLVIASKYDINLAKEFMKSMDELEARLS